MSTLLHLDASPRNDCSHSRRLSAFFVQQWLERHPGDTVLSRDLRVFTPPHVNCADRPNVTPQPPEAAPPHRSMATRAVCGCKAGARI
jgi:FMN-dependent NADH-azoreductase